MRSPAKQLGLGALVLVGVVAVALGLVARRYVVVQEVVLDGHLHALLNGGGNSVVLATGHGALVVDTKLSLPARHLFERALALGHGHVLGIVDTHYHFDHTHGNPLYPPGTTIWAAPRVPQLLRRFDPAFWKAAPASRMMPNQLVATPQELDFDGERVRLVPLPPAHTGGDLAVLFEKERVLVTGDVVLDGFYPIFDLPGGGSIPGSVRACDLLLSLPFDTIVPGHGPVGTRAQVVQMRAFDQALWNHAQTALLAHETVAEAVRDAPASLRGRDDLPFFSSLPKDLTWATQELQACTARDDCPSLPPTP